MLRCECVHWDIDKTAHIDQQLECLGQAGNVRIVCDDKFSSKSELFTWTTGSWHLSFLFSEVCILCASVFSCFTLNLSCRWQLRRPAKLKKRRRKRRRRHEHVDRHEHVYTQRNVQSGNVWRYLFVDSVSRCYRDCMWSISASWRQPSCSIHYFLGQRHIGGPAR